MATKLKDLIVTKVDFVDEGANPDAHIMLYKSKDGNDGKEAAPDDAGGEKNPGIWKKLVAFIAKAAGMGQEEIDSAIEEIQKGDSVSFNEKINEVNNRKIADEMWDICYALQSSLCSILNDEDLDSTGSLTAMQSSVDEFCGVVKESIQQWSEGKAASIVMKSEDVTEADLEIMKSARDRLTETIEKASASTGEPENNIEQPKGDDDMGIKIDKSKMTPAERAFYEDIEKRCGVDDGGSQATEGGAATAVQPPAGPTVAKSAAPTQAEQITEEPTVAKSITSVQAEPTQHAGEPDDIYKGLHPAVKAELEGLKKFREAAEERELAEVAKKYAIIGKKEEELVPLFKSLRAAGGTAYNDMIAVLDQAVATVEKSGAFTEIGKSGHGSNDGGAWAEADVKAVELMKSRTGISKAQALDEVLMADPELAARCEKED